MTLEQVLVRLLEQEPKIWNLPSSWSVFSGLLLLAADLEEAAPTVRVLQEVPLPLLQDTPRCPANTP